MWLLVNLGPSTSSRKKGRSTGDVVVAPKKGGKSTKKIAKARSDKGKKKEEAEDDTQGNSCVTSIHLLQLSFLLQ